MSIRNLDKAFRPAGVVLIGGSGEKGSVGAVALRNLTGAGFKGPVHLVGGERARLAGLPVHARVADLPETPDLAVIASEAAIVPDLVRDLGARGTRAAVVLSAGFAAGDATGEKLRRELLAAARPNLLRVIGPDTLGIIVPHAGLNASFAHASAIAGELAFVSQSSALAAAVLDWAKPRGIGFSHIVALGNVADVDFGDMLDYLAMSAEARAILLYAEEITQARKFMSAARAAARSKPVVIVKAGRLANSGESARLLDRVYDAAFRRAGFLRVRRMTELFAAAETLALTHRQRGDRLAILTNGTGPGTLAVDALAEAGGRLAEFGVQTKQKLEANFPDQRRVANPIDMPADATAARQAAALAAVLEDPDVDAALVLHSPSALEAPVEAAEAVIGAVRARPDLAAQGRNVFTAWLGEETAGEGRRLFAEARIPSYASLDDAVAGFMHRVRYRRNQDLLMQVPHAPSDETRPDLEWDAFASAYASHSSPLSSRAIQTSGDSASGLRARGAAEAAITAALAAGRRWLDPAEVGAVLDAYGIPMARTRAVADGEEAAKAAGAMGEAVALKIRSADIAHKGEMGGVALHVEGMAQVRAAAASMLRRVRRARPEARLEGFFVQEMIARPGALELAVGLIDGRIFGPVVMFGAGGAAARALDDTSLELPPLNMALARWQIARTRIWRLLEREGGEQGATVEAVARVLMRVGDIACEHAEVEQLLIDPLLADTEGVIALDARIAVRPSDRPAAQRLAILPYPAELEAALSLADGTPIRIRPIRPEDEPRLHEMLRRMSAEDVRLRFLVAMTEMPHALAARLTQIDYDREMALIALADDGSILGVARFSADPDNTRAEFAVAVRTDRKRRGLGRVLMRHLLAVARQRAIGEVFGDVAAENAPMLGLCRSLGFRTAPHPDDPQLVRVSIRSIWL